MDLPLSLLYEKHIYDYQLNKVKHPLLFHHKNNSELKALIQLKANCKPFGLTAILELLYIVLNLKKTVKCENTDSRKP